MLSFTYCTVSVDILLATCEKSIFLFLQGNSHRFLYLYFLFIARYYQLIFFSFFVFELSGTEAGPSKPHGEGGRPPVHRGADPAAAQHAVCGPASLRAGRRGKSPLSPRISALLSPRLSFFLSLLS